MDKYVAGVFVNKQTRKFTVTVRPHNQYLKHIVAQEAERGFVYIELATALKKEVAINFINYQRAAYSSLGYTSTKRVPVHATA